MSYISPELVKEARKVDLITYLRNYEPEELVQCGKNEYCTKSHDSLKLSNGKWFWWSRGIGGKSALDYFIKVRNMDFVSAVEAITGRVAAKPPLLILQKEKRYPKLYLPHLNFECRKVKPYLMSRGIDESIINNCIERKMIAEDYRYQYALFIGRDERGEAKQCSVRATDGTIFKREAAGSDKRFSFRLLSDCERKTLHVFESAIDLLSFATLMKLMGRDFTKENLMSLSGVYMPGQDSSKSKVPIAIEKYLQDYPGTELIILNLDSDKAGKLAAAGIAASLVGRVRCEYRPPPYGKDFNDYLMLRIKNSERNKLKSCDMMK